MKNIHGLELGFSLASPPEHLSHLVPAQDLAVLLVPPNAAEGVEVLVQLQGVPGDDHQTLFNHGHLQVERHEFKEANVKSVITNSCDNASPEGGLIFLRRRNYADIDIAFLMDFSCGTEVHAQDMILQKCKIFSWPFP